MDGKNYEFDGETYIHTDTETGVKYRWNQGKNEWELLDTGTSVATNAENKYAGSLKAPESSTGERGASSETSVENSSGTESSNTPTGSYTYDGDTAIYTDPTDGTPYEWDKEKKAWIPRVDEEFIARYQLSYGFTEESRRTPAEIIRAEREAAAIKEQEQLELKAKKRNAAGQKEEPTWFEVDERQNTKVYVSGLPSDIKEQEFVDMMQKCGLVMKDVETGRMKVKLYTDAEGNLKGDALCTYIKVESVELALQLIDGSDLRGNKLHVERAKFQMKGSYNPNLKPKKRKRKDKEKLKKMQEKLFDWHPDKLRGERSRHERCVVVKNLFDPDIFDKEVSLILEYTQDLREECGKCGDVRKVILYDKNTEGVAQIFFREAEEADECIKLLNNRWFGQRKITAETWDGKTKYKVGETDAEIQQRLQNWESFLATEDNKTDALSPNAASADTKPGNQEDKSSGKAEQEPVTSEQVKSVDESSRKRAHVESDAESGDETEEETEDNTNDS